MSTRFVPQYRTASRGRPTKLFLLSSAVLAALVCCQSSDETVPEDLLGVWVMSRAISPRNSKAERYADRFFEIAEEHLVFGTGNGNSDKYAIWNIEQAPGEKEDRILYHIYYFNTTGDEYKFSFYYDPAGGGEIVFANQQSMVWTREER